MRFLRCEHLNIKRRIKSKSSLAKLKLQEFATFCLPSKIINTLHFQGKSDCAHSRFFAFVPLLFKVSYLHIWFFEVIAALNFTSDKFSNVK